MNTWQRFLDETIPSREEQEELRHFFGEHLMCRPQPETSAASFDTDLS